MKFLRKIWDSINLAVGNDAEINLASPEYKSQIAWSIISVYLVMFASGLFLNDLMNYQHVLHFEKGLNLLATAMVFSLGTKVIWRSYKQLHKIYYLPVISVLLMGAQAGFMFNLFPMPSLHILFHMVSIFTIMFLYSLSSVYKTNGK